MPIRGEIALRDRQSKNGFRAPLSSEARIFRFGWSYPDQIRGRKQAAELNSHTQSIGPRNAKVENAYRRGEIAELPGIGAFLAVLAVSGG